MLNIEEKILEYFKNKSTTSVNIILSPRNVGKNLGIKQKLANKFMHKSQKLERVSGKFVGSNKHFSNILLYKLKV